MEMGVGVGAAPGMGMEMGTGVGVRAGMTMVRRRMVTGEGVERTVFGRERGGHRCRGALEYGH